MKRFKNPLRFILGSLPFLIVFIFSIDTPSDPDLGWHLKYGEYFFQHGSVLRDNTFSTLMPNYHWANTSWLTDVLTYAVFHFGGFFGLTLLGASVVTLTFYFFSKVARLTLWDQAFLFPLLLYLEQPINAISFRGQQISLLLIGVLFFLLSRYKDRPKILYLTIPLFFLWANLHGEFLLGIVLFGLWIALYAIKGIKSIKGIKGIFINNRSQIIYLTGIFTACVAVTVVNPFGIGIHTTAISHIGSPLLKNIAEYLPFDMYSQVWWNQIVVAILLVFGFIYLFFKNKVTEQIPLLGAVLIVFALSFEVRRYAWPAYYLILPLLKPIASFFQPDGKKLTYSMTIIFLLVLLSIAVLSKYPFTKYTNYSWSTYCQSQFIKCSPESAEYLIKHKLNHDLYTLYGWGGWIIWNYPEIKPTIDGRMHLWQKDGYSGFEDYYAVEQDLKNIDKTKYNIVFMSYEKPVYTRLKTLVNQDKWELVYEDKFAGIFVRKK